MNKLFRFLTPALALGLLAGCGSTKMAVRPDAANHIQSIAVVRVVEPETYVANDFGNPGMMFGAVGGAVAGASAASAGEKVTQIAREADFHAGERLTHRLEQELAAAGYRVNLVSVTRDNGRKLLEDYSGVDAIDADAILDVAIESFGYATEHPMFSRHWRPASQVHVALIDSRSGETLYADKFMYGYHNPLMSGTDIEAPEDYHFSDREALFADSTKLVDGMEHSVEAVVAEIAGNLRK